MPTCNWCQLESEDNEVCSWCRQPMVGGRPVVYAARRSGVELLGDEETESRMVGMAGVAGGLILALGIVAGLFLLGTANEPAHAAGAGGDKPALSGLEWTRSQQPARGQPAAPASS